MFNSIESKQPNHLDNGFDVTCTHSGQKRRYGDTFREFTVKSEKPESEVKQYCTEKVRKCDLTYDDYIANERAGVKDFGDHFRASYKFHKIRDGVYFYQITEPSTH
jgi:hypothetical protein